MTITWTQSESFKDDPKKVVTATHKQNADSILSGGSGYDNPVIDSFSYPVISAGGGTVSPSYTWYQTVHWTSGKTTTISSGGTITFRRVSGSATVNSASGTVQASSKGATASNSTTAAVVEITVTANGKSGTKQVSATLEANRYSDSWGSWNVIISVNPTTIPASGGTSMLSGTAR